MPDPSIQDLVRQEAQRQGIPPALALAVAEQESSFNPTAIGPKLPSGESAIGTFQLLPSTAQTLGVNPQDPVQNIRGGVQYLRQLLDQNHGDLQQVLKIYGGVRTDTKYVPGVMARVQKYAAATPPSSRDNSADGAVTPPPRPRSLSGSAMDLGATIIRGLDPRTPEGRQNIAGGLGAAALTAVLPEVAGAGLLVRGAQLATPVVGAYLGGGAEQAGEDVAAGKSPSLAAAHQAGTGQAALEAGGQVVAWPLKALGRRVMAASAAKSISTGLSDALDAAAARIKGMKPAVSPAEAGRLVEGTAYGPAKAVKDELGEAVGQAAETGPGVPTAPLKARLAELSDQITPAVSHEQAAALPPQALRVITEGPDAGKPRVSPEVLKALTLPTDHPLPRTLAAVDEALTNAGDTISFADAHKIKRALDDAVNWDSPAKKQVQQITKGFRQTLREVMSSHEPYNAATEDYRKVAQLYTKPVQKLHQEVLSNPEGIVSKLKWQNPSSARLLKELTVDTPAQAGAGGAQQGEAAWNAVRAAWTHENLVAKGPKGMLDTIAKMEGSGNGQEFLRTVYGDPQGQMVLQNLKQIGQAWVDAGARIDQFAETKLAQAPGARQTLADVAAVGLHGHPIYKARAATRLIAGPSVKELTQWAAYSPQRTQFLIKHVLTGPDPGTALADMARWVQGSEAAGTEPDQPQPSHTVEPPPAPRMLSSHPR